MTSIESAETLERPPTVRRASRETEVPTIAEAPAPVRMMGERGLLLTREDQERYILAGTVDAAGHAHGGRITVVSRATSKRFTFQIKPPSSGRRGDRCQKCVGGYLRGDSRYPCFACGSTGIVGSAPPERFFVSVLTGCDNTRDYTFIGQIVTSGSRRYDHGKRAHISPDAPSGKAATWYFSRVIGRGDVSSVEVWHDSTCGRCGRDLTDPDSISRGIGPDCWEKMGF